MLKEYSGIKVTVNEEDLKKTGVIYLLEFPNGKVYIGQTTMFLYRRIGHHCEKANGCRKLKNAIQKYKEFKVSVLSSNLTLEQLNVYEAFFIKAYNSTGKEEGYNLDSGGKNKTTSEETRNKLSDALKGRIVSEETKKKMSESRKGVKHNDEWCKKIGTSLLKKVKSIPDSIIFNSVKEASTYYGIAEDGFARYYNGNIHKKSGQTFVKI